MLISNSRHHRSQAASLDKRHDEASTRQPLTSVYTLPIIDPRLISKQRAALRALAHGLDPGLSPPCTHPSSNDEDAIAEWLLLRGYKEGSAGFRTAQLLLRLGYHRKPDPSEPGGFIWRLSR